MNEQDNFHLIINRTTAYLGPTGIKREKFCIDYMQKKLEVFNELRQKQSEIVLNKSETIICRESCSHCCMLMVSASIQEVELIVYYLYKNEKVFNAFIKTYPLWISKIHNAGSLLKDLPEFKNQSKNDESTEQEPVYDMFSNRIIFAKQKIYCPFLYNGKCSIYEVRPFFCAGYIATSPCEWCNPMHPDYNKKKTYQTFNIDLADDHSFYTGNLGKRVWSFMPLMVYETLRYGTEALYKMQIFTLEEKI